MRPFAGPLAATPPPVEPVERAQLNSHSWRDAQEIARLKARCEELTRELVAAQTHGRMLGALLGDYEKRVPDRGCAHCVGLQQALEQTRAGLAEDRRVHTRIRVGLDLARDALVPIEATAAEYPSTIGFLIGEPLGRLRRALKCGAS